MFLNSELIVKSLRSASSRNETSRTSGFRESSLYVSPLEETTSISISDKSSPL